TGRGGALAARRRRARGRLDRADPVRSDTRLCEARAAQPARVPGALLIARDAGSPLWSGPRARAVDVVGLGQISLDRVAALPRWPRAGEKLALATPAVVRPGGQIATAVLAAVRLGLSGRLIGAVGDDAESGPAPGPPRAARIDPSGG